MDSTLYRSEGKITAQVDDFPDATDPVGSFVTLSFKQGAGALRMTLPFHMSACAHMIVEAFNAHMEQPVAEVPTINYDALFGTPTFGDGNGPYDADRVTTPFPTGAATSLGLAVALAANLDADEQAAHAVERRDLP